ncbi:hypothetical protein C8R31_10292 [Nitrosospira sp. Nsp2]|nr:hypothetical protein C8R31_10292 [Nitrosospira sp. Nsp2]
MGLVRTSRQLQRYVCHVPVERGTGGLRRLSLEEGLINWAIDGITDLNIVGQFCIHNFHVARGKPNTHYRANRDRSSLSLLFCTINAGSILVRGRGPDPSARQIIFEPRSNKSSIPGKTEWSYPDTKPN